MYNVMLSLRSLDEESCRQTLSMELSRLEGLVTTDERYDAPLLEDYHYVLSLVNNDTQKALAKITTFSMSPQRRQIQKLVEQQELVANELKKDSSWAERYRTHVDNHGTLYVLENDLTNPRLGKFEHGFLMKILEAPRKHYIWKEAADQISSPLHAGERPLVCDVLKILDRCLEITRLDQEKLHSLQDESKEQDSYLWNWLPQTISRILGENVEDGAPNGEEKLRDRFGQETFMISRFLIDMRYMEDERNEKFLAKVLKHAPLFTPLIPMLSLQQKDIEGEIEYLRKKVENMDRNQN
ncbi:uncharacterized protein Triagg1_2146 [Trichoderma aggressivum f. europaeum]|uniref:Uncharacterized protein n=1 Tax=Trichoderma aggressivum f. europaeum TaxID=173218 RepID=A0AAE1M2F3_9HYPO|nr:hypothetical protein Triagg1_2146 [Trichoderma aggressivum f. europaeum]